MAKSNIPNEVLQPIIKNILGELHESLNSNLLYFLFNTIAADYNREEGPGSLQKIFISNWVREVHKHFVIPEIKRIGKELNKPHFAFDSLITETDSLAYEDIISLYGAALKTVELGFLEATSGADDGAALDD